MMEITGYSKCSCGAITLYAGDEAYSVYQKNFRRFFPRIDLRALRAQRYQETYCCNHCVNHFGLDLCACGSGDAPDECVNGLSVCGTVMQKLGEYTRVTDSSGWVASGMKGVKFA